MNNQNKITNFFSTTIPSPTPTVKIVEPVVLIPGLTIMQEYITEEEETKLLDEVYASQWSNSLRRRVQHYGYAYNYQERTTATEPIQPLPGWTQSLASRLYDDGFFAELPTQLIVNEYTPGQGIGSHTDANVFGPSIATLSLGSTCGFIFTRGNTPDTLEKVEIFLKPRTLVVMTGEARWVWKHCILQRKQDIAPNGDTIKRSTRVSLTFRTMVQ